MDLIVSVPELTYLLLITEGVGEGANLFVALWFILRGGLFLCLALFCFVFCVFRSFGVAITSLGVFPLPFSVSGKGCGL